MELRITKTGKPESADSSRDEKMNSERLDIAISVMPEEYRGFGGLEVGSLRSYFRERSAG